MKKNLLILFLLFSFNNLFATTRTAAVSGNWFTGSTWGGTIPVSGDIAIIPAGITVTLNLPSAGVVNTPWNNPSAIKISGTFTMLGTDPLFSNPTAIEVFSGGKLNDFTDFNEYYLTQVTTIKVYTGGQYNNDFGSTNLLNVTSQINFLMPVAPIAGPFTVTVSGGQITYVASILPLQLLSFNAKEIAGANQLTWQTANEINTADFYIERSNDAIHFTVIGQVAAVGTTQKGNYSFTDTDPLQGYSYYRLRMADADGRITYSNVVKMNRSAQSSMSIYPSPAKDIIHVITSTSGKLSIFNVAGKLVRTQVITAGNTTIDISSLSDGVYFINMNGERTSFIKASN